MGFATTWLRQVSPPPASQNHFNHWITVIVTDGHYLLSWHVQYDVAVYTERDTMFDWLSADNGTARLGQH